jgi:hypothetical protein
MVATNPAGTDTTTPGHVPSGVARRSPASLEPRERPQRQSARARRGRSCPPDVVIEGEAGGFFKLAEPLVVHAVERELANNLATLKDVLEADEATG